MLPSVGFLVYLLFVAQDVADFSHGTAAVCGYAVVVLFATVFAVYVRSAPEMTQRLFWSLYLILFALFVAELPFARAGAFVLCVYITVISVARFGVRSVPIVLGFAAAALLVPTAIPSWHDSLATSFDDITPVAIPIAAIITYPILQVVETNRALALARAEITRLAAENERVRIGRDLHDLLGHSLTTIAVKAGLARQLGDIDPASAIREIGEVEALARDSLADIRAAVSGIREITLEGELATGRQLLQAAGIAADLPASVNVVDPGLQELFGWAVREGLTNVVRHARASRCTIRISHASVEIVDNGSGGDLTPGNGLSGLRERVTASGGSLEAGPIHPGGWRLRAVVPTGGRAS